MLKKLFAAKLNNKGEINIALTKPSRVLLGLTLDIKGLFPNFFPAK